MNGLDQERDETPSQQRWKFHMQTALQEKSSSNRVTEELPLIYARTVTNGSTTKEALDNNGASEQPVGTPSDNKTPSPVVLPLPEEPSPLYNFQSLQQWEGTTIKVTKTRVVVRLRDIDNPRNPEKRTSISLDDISDSDRSFVSPGAVFYWTLGYRIETYGQKSLVSAIRFRRLPSWTPREMERARTLSSKYDAFFTKHD